MFDTHVTKHESKVVAVTQVVEKTITPDRVTDMYDKVRAEVESDIIQKILIKTDWMSAIVLVSLARNASGNRRIACSFKLNNETYTDVLFTFDDLEMVSSDEKVLEYVIGKISKVLAIELTRQAVGARIIQL